MFAFLVSHLPGTATSWSRRVRGVGGPTARRYCCSGTFRLYDPRGPPTRRAVWGRWGMGELQPPRGDDQLAIEDRSDRPADLTERDGDDDGVEQHRSDQLAPTRGGPVVPGLSWTCGYTQGRTLLDRPDGRSHGRPVGRLSLWPIVGRATWPLGLTRLSVRDGGTTTPRGGCTGRGTGRVDGRRTGRKMFEWERTGRIKRPSCRKFSKGNKNLLKPDGRPRSDQLAAPAGPPLLPGTYRPPWYGYSTP